MQKEVKVSKKEVKVYKKNLYLTILRLLNDRNKPTNPSKIAIKLDFSKQRMNHYVKTLKDNKEIINIGYGTWEVTKKGKEKLLNLARSKSLTLGMREDYKSNLHALNINIPIISGKLDLVKDLDGYYSKAMKGWTPQYKRVLAPLGYTIRNNNNKSVDLFLFSREMPRNFDICQVISGLLIHSHALLKEKGVTIDIFKAKTQNLHISVKNKDLDKVFNKKEKFEVLLNRNCRKILPNDPERKAKAWVDGSPYLGQETNDLEYKENLIMMPERVAGLTDWTANIEDYNRNIKKHLSVLDEMSETLKLIREDLNK